MLSTQARVWPIASTGYVPRCSVNLASHSQLSLAAAQYRTASRHLGPIPTRPATGPSCEHAGSCLPSKSAYEGGQRRMMHPNIHHTSPVEPVFFDFNLPGTPLVPSTLPFTASETPHMGLTFSPRPLPTRPNKRYRAVADIDGEHSCTQKKKRRLRLILITSRLSPQFSHPATNIVDRGSSKIAVWAKQKALGRNLLRKAAILNDIRRTTVSPRSIGSRHEHSPLDQEKEKEQFELARLEFDHGSLDTYTRPVVSQTPSVPPSAAVRTGGRFIVSGSPSSSPTSSRSPSPTPLSPPLKASSEVILEYRSPNEAYAYSPLRAQTPQRDYVSLPPSPLGLSNYDAFDLDDAVPDPYSHLDDDDDDVPIPNPYDDDIEGEEVPFLPSATAQTFTFQALKTPPPALFADFSLLDHSEPVFGDYDQVDDGADPVWPDTVEKQDAPTSVSFASTSPNFPALFAVSPPSKRTDSFATALRPTSISPNFPPSSISPNFNTPTTTAGPASPNLANTPRSPNFSTASAPFLIKTKYKGLQEIQKDMLLRRS